MYTNMPHNQSLRCQRDACTHTAKTQPKTAKQSHATYLYIPPMISIQVVGFFSPQTSSFFGYSRNLFYSELEDMELSSN